MDGLMREERKTRCLRLDYPAEKTPFRVLLQAGGTTAGQTNGRVFGEERMTLCLRIDHPSAKTLSKVLLQAGGATTGS